MKREDNDAALVQQYYVELATAFVRGRLSHLPTLGPGDTLRHGLAAGLRLHKFKRNAELPRVRRVLGILRALAPESLLDVGSGRGTFLWPLLDSFPTLLVTAIDHDLRRAMDLQAVAAGGAHRLTAKRMNAAHLDFPDDAFDGVTLLEVLEHVPRPEALAAEAVRVAHRFVIASVPSKEDDNPAHIHLFNRHSLGELFTAAGARRLKFEQVLNHIIVLAGV